jgi:hypothetical protein
MDSASDTAEAVGCPIRKPTDQSLLAAPRGLSQRAASFVASQCQGIHQMPFRRLISLTNAPRAGESPQGTITARTASGKDASHDPTDCRPKAEVTALSGHPRSQILHMSKIPYPAQRISAVSLTDISHARSSLVIEGHCSSLTLPPGGGGRDRTDDLMLAKHALSQLSYAPMGKDQENSGGPGKT